MEEKKKKYLISIDQVGLILLIIIKFNIIGNYFNSSFDCRSFTECNSYELERACSNYLSSWLGVT